MAVCLIAAILGLRATAQDAPNFEEHVKPIFRSSCNQCHNPDKAKGGLDMSSYAALMRGGSSGAAVVPGDPDGSALFLSMAHKKEPFMPKEGDMRPAAELDIIRKWIAGGLIERRGGVARKAESSNIGIDLKAVAGGKPEGPPPMPEFDSPPVFVSSRANAIKAMAASPWAPLVAIGGESQVVLYHSDSLDLLATLPFPEGTPVVLRFSRNAKLLLCGGGVGGQSGRVVLFDVAGGGRVAEVGDEYDTVLAADVSANQKLVALGGPQRVIRVFNTKDGEKAYEIRKHTEWVTAMEFSPDGILLASGDRNGGLFVWESDGGQPFYDLAGHQGAITKVSWRADGNVLASASEDGTVKLWNALDGKQLRSFTAHDGGVQSVEFARDGKLVTCGRDKSVKTWGADGKELRKITGFDDIATAAVFTHDAARVVAGDWRGAVKVFATSDGGLCGRLRANPPSIAEQILDAMAAREPAQKRADELQALARQAKTALEGAQTELDKASKVVGEKVARIQAAEQALAAARKDLDGALAETAAAKRELAGREADLAARRERARLATEKEDQKRAEVDGMQGQLAEKSKLAEDMKRVVAEARAAARPSKNDAALFESLDHAEKQGKEAADVIAWLNTKIPEARTAFEGLVVAAKEANSVIKAGQDAVNEAKAAVDAKQSAANATTAKKDEAEKNLASARSEKEGADKGVADRQAKVNEAQAAATTAAQTAAAAKADLASTEKRSDRLKAEQFDSLLKTAEERLASKGAGPFPLPQVVEAAQKAVSEIPPYVAPPTDDGRPASAAARPPRPETPRSLLFVGRFHMVMLHLPIGALLLAFILELDHLVRRTERFDHFIGQCLRFGAFTAVVTAIMGLLLSYDPLYDPAELSRHKWTGIYAAAASVVAAWLRHKPWRVAPAGYWMAILATAGLLGVAGHEGGSLTRGPDYLTEYLPDWMGSMRGRSAFALAGGHGNSEFEAKIKPILDAHCASCHGAEKQKGKYRLDDRAVAFAGGESKKASIVAGDAMKSELVRRLLLPRSHDDVMPPSNKAPMKPADVLAVVQWINEGADWPDAPKPKPAPAKVAAASDEKPVPSPAQPKAQDAPATKQAAEEKSAKPAT